MINETKQTAIDWLYFKLSTSSSEEMIGNINLWFEQAKEMHKEEIMDAFDKGCDIGCDIGSNYNYHDGHNQGYDYYNETYGGNK